MQLEERLAKFLGENRFEPVDDAFARFKQEFPADDHRLVFAEEDQEAPKSCRVPTMVHWPGGSVLLIVNGTRVGMDVGGESKQL